MAIPSSSRLLKKTICGRRNRLVAVVETDLTCDGAIALDVGPTVTLGFIHFIVAVPGEGDMVAISRVGEVSSDAAEGEFTRTVGVEEDVGGLHHARIVLDRVGHRHDPPASMRLMSELPRRSPAAWAGEPDCKRQGSR